jgi:hypothetical protein
MSLTPAERKDKLNRLLELLQTSRYSYAKERGRVGIETLPPAQGTAMNCESAARIFMQIAADMGVDRLQALYYEATAKNAKGDKMGYFVLQERMAKALGNGPEINKPPVVGWEFDNHWRVKDPDTGIIYDPTFGTSSPLNLKGILGTSMTTGKNWEMTTVYGKKYTITRQGVSVTCTVANTPVSATDTVGDEDFLAKTMTGLRA